MTMAKGALLPVDRIDGRIIGSLKPGEAGWVVPWAMHVGHDRSCWLDPAVPVHNERAGSVELAVERLAAGARVWLPSGQKWRPRGDIDEGYLLVVEFGN